MTRPPRACLALIAAWAAFSGCRNPCTPVGGGGGPGEAHTCNPFSEGGVPASYVTRYANASNVARVAVDPRVYGRLSAEADLSNGDAPELILVAPSGDHIVIQRSGRRTVDILERNGAFHHGVLRDEGAARSIPYVTDRGGDPSAD